MIDKANLIRTVFVTVTLAACLTAGSGARADGFSIDVAGGGMGFGMNSDAGFKLQVGDNDDGLPLPTLRRHSAMPDGDDEGPRPSVGLQIDVAPVAGDSGSELADKLDDALALEEAKALGHDKLLPKARTACLEISHLKSEIMQLIAKKDQIRATTADKTLRGMFIRDIDEQIAHAKEQLKYYEKACNDHYK